MVRCPTGCSVSRIERGREFSLCHPVEQAGDVGEKLLFPGDDAVETPDELAFFGEVEEAREAFRTAHYQQGILRIHIGDEEHREKVAVREAVFFEFLEQGGALFFE